MTSRMNSESLQFTFCDQGVLSFTYFFERFVQSWQEMMFFSREIVSEIRFPKFERWKVIKNFLVFEILISMMAVSFFKDVDVLLNRIEYEYICCDTNLVINGRF